MKRRVWVSAATVLSASCAVIVTAGTGARADGTWTRITAPKGPGGHIMQLVNADENANPTLTISGSTSADVTGVNVYCFWNLDQRTSSNPPLNGGSALPVSAGAFSGTVAAPQFGAGGATPSCLLRAVPSTYTQIDGAGNNTGYVAAFSGPTFYAGRLTPHHTTTATNSPVVGWELTSAHQQAWNWLGGPADDSLADAGPADDVANTVGPSSSDGFLDVSRTNVTRPSGSSTHSGIVVDGKSAYLPAALAYLATVPANVPGISLHAQRNSTGAVVVHERDHCALARKGSSRQVAAAR
jgi:hypothetical protein